MAALTVRGCGLLMLTLLVTTASAEDAEVRDPHTVWCQATDADDQGNSRVIERVPVADPEVTQLLDELPDEQTSVSEDTVGESELPVPSEETELPPDTQGKESSDRDFRSERSRKSRSGSRRKYRLNAIRDFADEKFETELDALREDGGERGDSKTPELLDATDLDLDEPDDLNKLDGMDDEDDQDSQVDTIPATERSVEQINLSAVFTDSPRSIEPQPLTLDAGPRDPVYGKEEQTIYPWTARGLAHRTLYFEDMPLERYGRSAGPVLQPVKSGVRFLADTLTAPLQFLHERPCHLHYVLPLDRPGNCSPNLKQPVVPYVPQ